MVKKYPPITPLNPHPNFAGLDDMEKQTADDLADEIKMIADAVDDMMNGSGLKQSAIIVLLQDKTKLPRKTIKTVLDAIPRLRDYLK